MTKNRPFQLSVAIDLDLDDRAVRGLVDALAGSGAGRSWRRIERRFGVSWEIEFGGAERPEVLMQELVGLGEDVARSIAHAAEGNDGAVGISLCQSIRDVDDPQQKGIWFSKDAIRWAAVAGASIGIDQYLYID